MNENFINIDDLVTPGSNAHKLFHALPVDHYVTRGEIAELSALHISQVSPLLTKLRRSGWIEYNPQTGRPDRAWRRRNTWAPPQDDLAHRRKLGERVPQDKGAEWHLEQAQYHLMKAREGVAQVAAIQRAVLGSMKT